MPDKVDWFRHFEDIWDAAMTRPPADRAAFLREACRDDDASQLELEVTLVDVSRAEEFLEQPLAAVVADVMEPPTDTVLTGRRFNTLQIGKLIGAGGMGHVYRARDTELNRNVAVKVLSPEFADDADRLLRFAREARVLASLNHPNIAQIHGLQSSGGVTAIVMELVAGETLADLIARGPIAVNDALPIARQIAAALEAAHEQGVVHRDLKPANIQVRTDSTVKVLDFGLAKTVHPTSDEADDLVNPAAVSSVPGVVLGTAAYISPEQASQKPVDRRVDMWAFGCVLFEMLTARPAFTGETRSAVVREVIGGEPDWAALPASTPPAIRRLLRRCLEKDAGQRLDSAAAARLEIDESQREASSVVSSRSNTRQRSAWATASWLLFGALAALLVTMTVVERARPSEQSRPLMVMSMTVDGPRLVHQAGVHFSLAPNGRTIVYSGPHGGNRVLYRKDLDRLDPEPIVGTEGGSDAFFSGDGRRIGFETRSELWSTSLDGGTPRRLHSNHPTRGGTWGEAEGIVTGRLGSGLWLTSAEGGESRQLTIPATGERHELPQLLPGGRGVLFTILDAKKPPRAAVVLLHTRQVRDIFEGVGARYVDSGHVVFGRHDKLWAVGFDLDSLQTRGVARRVREDVLWSPTGYPQFTVGGDALAYVRSSEASASAGKTVLMWVNRRGEAETLPLAPENYLLAALSPAGDRFVVQVGPSRDLWTYSFNRGTFTRLTSGRVVAFSAPTWTPDGSRIVFTTSFDGDVGFGWVRPDGSGSIEALVKGIGMRSFERTDPDFLPDGSGIITTGLAPGASLDDLLIVRLTGKVRLETLLQAPGVERNPAISPDGRAIAYNSDASGRREVYVRPFPNVGARMWQISTGGGAGPRWTRGGRELVYVDDQGRVMAVSVRADGEGRFEFSRPEPLFTYTAATAFGLDREFDVSADGERFLFHGVPTASASGSSVELVLIHNWVDELKRLVPREP
ncbi:Serine/threonine-protein kinase PrkC [Luteitalea pratensis]|uniref:Serine/threonine-protein kinase PrkC n=1 Tax=Luteitalea pratensis TaxID=1855912 RepID=A0A143PHL7_LUTPR|nr:protein kinase [Luteitalea pratensis]AMY07770.1 Serine/threonine-protein kinase PrkC [Luteitalea pratensis]